MAAALTVLFEFEGAPDYNFQHTDWSGPLPHVAHTLEMQGRSGVWIVDDVRWVFDLQRAKSTLGKAVKVHLSRNTGV
jgi:hypothetical protein